jgi:hypothetical protein
MTFPPLKAANKIELLRKYGIARQVVNEETGSVLQLTGIAVSTRYANDYYLAAYYGLTKTTTPQQALSDPGPRRMWLMILEPAKDLVDYWRKAIEINNPPASVQQQQLQISQFIKMINYPIKTGDTIIIDYVPNVGTKVVIKGSFKGLIKGNEFFDLLLKTWLGRFPPSEKFRYDLFNLPEGFTDDRYPGKV